MDVLKGSVDRIAYYNPDNGYTVLQLQLDRDSRTPSPEFKVTRQSSLVTVVGNLPEVNPGEHLLIQGRWVNHPKHGKQLKAENCTVSPPVTITGIQSYLGSGLIKGIGPGLARRIVDHFGTNALEIIEEQPERLREVPDIGPKRARVITHAWNEQRQVKEIMLFLHGHGISTNLAVKIYKTYGESSIQTVRENPYQLAQDIFGVGFKTADKIAQDLGLDKNHPTRVEAGIIYTLKQMSSEGHVYSPLNELTFKVVNLLEIETDLIRPALKQLGLENRICKDEFPINIGSSQQELQVLDSPELNEADDKSAIYLAPFYYSEVGVAAGLDTLTKSIPSRLSDIPPIFISFDNQLSEEQNGAIRTTLSHPVSVLTGGPGTGKTTCIKALISILESASKDYALASPTGRAAKRLSEAANRPASTIHRLLGYSPMEGFKFNEENQLQIDCLVVDETSMLDLVLANHLLKALEPGTHLLLVGDFNQLPSVGAGDVLRDVINSGLVPVTQLKTIFRQAEGSNIITNAHNINQGVMPVFSRTQNGDLVKSGNLNEGGIIISGMGDFFLFPASDPATASEWILEIVTDRIPRVFGFNPLTDIQVLAPMYRGDSGVTALNLELQKHLNPPEKGKIEIGIFGSIYREGDKVMQIRNNYDKEVFNGDIGFIKSINQDELQINVKIDNRVVKYDYSEADQLVLAYAVTVHKSQGSEFQVVVIPVITSHYVMLQRNLLYTAVTRAKELCVIVGNRKAIGIAVSNNKVAQRYSALGHRMRSYQYINRTEQ